MILCVTNSLVNVHNNLVREAFSVSLCSTFILLKHWNRTLLSFQRQQNPACEYSMPETAKYVLSKSRTTEEPQTHELSSSYGRSKPDKSQHW